MRPEHKKYLYDIEEAAEHIAQFTAGKTFADYLKDAMLCAAVERKFEIIGEALAQLSSRDPSIAAHVREYKRIISFRNILVHRYAGVDNQLVWGMMESKLPELRRDVQALLDQA